MQQNEGRNSFCSPRRCEPVGTTLGRPSVHTAPEATDEQCSSLRCGNPHPRPRFMTSRRRSWSRRISPPAQGHNGAHGDRQSAPGTLPVRFFAKFFLSLKPFRPAERYTSAGRKRDLSRTPVTFAASAGIDRQRNSLPQLAALFPKKNRPGVRLADMWRNDK